MDQYRGIEKRVIVFRGAASCPAVFIFPPQGVDPRCGAIRKLWMIGVLPGRRVAFQESQQLFPP